MTTDTTTQVYQIVIKAGPERIWAGGAEPRHLGDLSPSATTNAASRSPTTASTAPHGPPTACTGVDGPGVITRPKQVLEAA